MPIKPLVFISCGQYTEDEIDLGKEVEQFIRDESSFEPYFAENQNTLEGLVTNILSALGRTSAFIGIMHHRGTINTPSGDEVKRASIWVEQELAIASFIHHELDRQIEVALYLQPGISREGIRSQLRLNPVEFESSEDILSDLRDRIKTWNLFPSSTAPLIPRWNWNLRPGYTGERHEYEFCVELYNNSPEMINIWQVDICFPSEFINLPDTSDSLVHITISDSDYTENDKRIWPNTSMHVHTQRYFVTESNWPDGPNPPNVRIKVSTAKAPFYEEEISMWDIQRF